MEGVAVGYGTEEPGRGGGEWLPFRMELVRPLRLEGGDRDE